MYYTNTRFTVHCSLFTLGPMDLCLLLSFVLHVRFHRLLFMICVLLPMHTLRYMYLNVLLKILCSRSKIQKDSLNHLMRRTNTSIHLFSVLEYHYTIHHGDAGKEVARAVAPTQQPWRRPGRPHTSVIAMTSVNMSMLGANCQYYYSHAIEPSC